MAVKPLHKKTIHELRAIAQGYGIPDLFAKTDIQLTQAIELKQQEMVPDKPEPIPPPQYDARLMMKPPAKRSSQKDIEELLAPHVARGLHLHFDEERWYMQFDKRTDEGTLRMPLRTVLTCAGKIMK